jgi:hypothetical protein
MQVKKPALLRTKPAALMQVKKPALLRTKPAALMQVKQVAAVIANVWIWGLPVRFAWIGGERWTKR